MSKLLTAKRCVRCEHPMALRCPRCSVFLCTNAQCATLCACTGDKLDSTRHE